MERPPLKKVFLQIAKTLSLRASCARMSVGALIVRDKHIISSGVNGPMGWDCTERGCNIENPCQHAIHAEANAILAAQRNGVELKGSTLYCTHQPCPSCAGMIVAVGISKVIYSEPYRLTEGLDILKYNNIETEQIEDVSIQDSKELERG